MAATCSSRPSPQAAHRRPERTRATPMRSRSRRTRSSASRRAGLGLLVGRAGTGKTSVLGALVRCDKIAKDGVLLLAPTGKARVRLQRSTGSRGEDDRAVPLPARPLRRRAPARLFTGDRAHRKEKTVVIDECSMLTMDDLYAVLQALDLGHVERLILVGDPNQLPPIGVGRPFADWSACSTRPPNDDASAPPADALARLTVEVRTRWAGRPTRCDSPRGSRTSRSPRTPIASSATSSSARSSTTSRSSPGARRGAARSDHRAASRSTSACSPR